VLHETLFGRAEHKKTINVEANLLAERHSSKLKVAQVARKRLAFVAASLAFGCVILPLLFRWQARSATVAASVASKEADLAKRLSALGSERDASVPKIADTEMVQIMRSQSDALLGQMILVLNSVPRSAVISSLRTEIIGGTVTMSCTAEADRFEGMREFLALAAKGPRAESTVLSSSKRSETLGKDGVQFQFVKKARVGQ